MTNLKIRNVPVGNLTPDPQNVRMHNARNIDAIKRSLSTFGQRKPIITAKGNDGSLIVIAGNGTLEAAKELEWTHIDILEVPDDWDADKARAFAIADNRTAELADWNEIELTNALLELDGVGYDIKDLGFDPSTIDDADLVEEDNVPDLPERATRTITGQIWQLGQHRMMVGDSTNAQDFQQLMKDVIADCVFTDPPYNVAYTGGTAEELTINNDNMIDEDFEQFLKTAYELMYDHTRAGGAIYVCHADSSGEIFRRLFVDTGWLLKQCLIWVKDNFVLGRQDYHWQHEPILYGWKAGAAHSWYGKRIRSTILESDTDIRSMKKQEMLDLLSEILENSTAIREPRPRRNAQHPTMKPLPLVARLIANSTQRGDIVLDPFGGSGSTLIACDQMQRICYTMENDPRYADVIIDRWEALTGMKAQLDEH